MADADAIKVLCSGQLFDIEIFWKWVSVKLFEEGGYFGAIEGMESFELFFGLGMKFLGEFSRGLHFCLAS